MTSTSSRSGLSLSLLMLVSVLACRDMPTGGGDSQPPSFKPAPGPAYTVLTAPVAPGWTGFSPWDINILHQAVGVMNPVGNTGQMARRAASWMAGSTAVPVALPVPDGKTWSVAVGISDNGIIGGHIFPAGVLWKPSGSGWEIVPLDGHAVVNDVRNDGSAAGTVYDPRYDTFREDPQPAAWDAAGVLYRLPMPPSGRWTGGEAFAVNAQGDVAGTFEERLSNGTWIWGALWIREGDGYTPVVMQTGWARGLSDRTADGRIYITASGVRDAYRHTFTQGASGAWTSDSVYVGGTGEDVSATGDFVGTIRKGTYSSSGYPFLYSASGSLVKLPIPRNASGGASGISNDGWITGTIDGAGVVWKP